MQSLAPGMDEALQKDRVELTNKKQLFRERSEASGTLVEIRFFLPDLRINTRLAMRQQCPWEAM